MVEREIFKEDLIRPFENEINWPEIIDLSGFGNPMSKRYNPQYLRDSLSDLKKTALRIVVFPDFSPTEEGRVPTGTATMFDAKDAPDYLRFVGGTDIGCQMRLSKLTLSEKEFRERPKLLEGVCQILRLRKREFDLGRGNHFLDFVSFEDGQMGVLVHTGSFGDKQEALGKLIDDSGRYWDFYTQVMDSARENIRGIISLVSKIYGQTEVVNSWVHNTISLNKEEGTVIIRKGAVEVSSLDQQFIIPASVGDRIILAKPGINVNADTLWSMPHGSGRKVARSEARVMAKEVYGEKVSSGRLTDISEISGFILPGSITGFPITELPFCYYSFEETKEILLSNKLVAPGSIQTLKIISCLNHL